MTQNTQVEDLLGRLKRLRAARSTWESHWQELAEMMLPRRADFTVEQAPGEKRVEKIFDGTAMQAVRGLASAIDFILKPKTSNWFSLLAQDEELNDVEEVEAWLENATARMRRAIYGRGAKFAQRTGEVDLDLVTFGTGLLFIGEKVGKGELLFRSLHLKNTYIVENAEGDIDTVFRTFKYTARQAVQAFGREAVGEKTVEALEGDEPDKEFRFLHAVLPREDINPLKRDARNMPFASFVVDIESEHLVEEGGFHEFPYAVPRWDTSTEEVYGRSPGMLALPDVNTLNAMGRTILRAGQKAADPPLLAPDDGVVGPPRLFPGGITYYDASLFRQRGVPIQPLQTGANLPLTLEMQNRTRDQIWAAFFRNVLQLPVPGAQMTATEILERRQEFLRVIGPTFERLETGYVGAITERVFNILLRAGVFAELPEALRGRRVKFEYVSSVAKAQKQIEIAAAASTVDVLAPFVAADPTIMDNFDSDKIARDIAEGSGVPHRWLKPLDRVQMIREARAQATAEEFAKSDAERLVGGLQQLSQVQGGQQ